MKIALSHLSPDPGQPRKFFDAVELQALAKSIDENGLMQAITVRKADKPGHFHIIAGERRYRAHVLLLERGVKRFAEIEATLSAPDTTADLRVLQIVENDQRANVTPLERARSYADLLSLGMSEEAAAKRIGIPSARFAARMSLVNLEPSIANLLAGGNIEEPQATEIARLPNQADQVKILQMINRGEIGKWKSVKAAVDTILEGVTQSDMFGAGAPKASAEDVKELNAMEAKIDQVSRLLAAGWKDGACIIANKVSPDRAQAMADKLGALRQTVRRMELEIRNQNAAVQVVLALAE